MSSRADHSSFCRPVGSSSARLKAIKALALSPLRELLETSTIRKREIPNILPQSRSGKESGALGCTARKLIFRDSPIIRAVVAREPLLGLIRRVLQIALLDPTRESWEQNVHLSVNHVAFLQAFRVRNHEQGIELRAGHAAYVRMDGQPLNGL
jgi:hypothetical protein